jgi:hypothetical protein
MYLYKGEDLPAICHAGIEGRQRNNPSIFNHGVRSGWVINSTPVTRYLSENAPL